MRAPIPPDAGIVLIDHGSRVEEANRLLDDVAQLLASVAGNAIVEPAHMELADPTLAQAFARCVARGAKTVIVQPYFLTPGRHSTRDIPRMTKEAAAVYPGVAWRVAEPIGVDTRVCEVLMDRTVDAFLGGESNDAGN